MTARTDVLSWAALVVVLAGCNGASSTGGVPAHPTYYENVAAIVQDHCVQCHSGHGIGPFALTTYDQVKAVAPAIKAATASHTMPPFHVDGSGDCNTYKDARLLTADEIAILGKWSDGGAPAGDPNNAPPPPPSQAKLARVDSTLDPGAAYQPNTSESDDYRCFIVDPGIATDKFLTAYEVHPGTPSEVHHVVLYSVDSAAEAAAAKNLDSSDPALGYTCFGGAMTGGGRTLAAWAPGTGATLYPANTGIRVKAGQPMILQVHYNKPTTTDRTTVDLTLEDQVPLEAVITGAIDANLNLQPAQATEMATSTAQIPPTSIPYRIWGVYPHMHKLGRTLRVDLTSGASDTCIVNVPDYNFSWQQFYFYDQPIVVPPSATDALTITCGYDTRGMTNTVHFGEGTADEMCIAGLYITL